MKSLSFFLALGLGFVSSNCVRGAAGEEKALDGTWKPVAAEMSGRSMPEAAVQAITLKIRNPNYEVTVNGEGSDQGLTKVDWKVSPKSIDILSTNGANKGKTIPAIYEVNGETLRVCYNLSGTNRPTEFKTMTNSRLFLVTYKLKKD